ncbi:MAG TPA: response regulator transcription factor [Burkholderiaceae bacterium]|jgi:DNA-binding NarL/FixJ family response regulator|nr:response regulator transcription factor [Burkholderiaceae bacterium]
MRILLVDDHALFREGVALLLRPLVEPLEIWEAGSCDEAFALIERRGPPDLMLLDLGFQGMPGIPGLENMQAFHEQCPDMPLVALSSTDDRATVLQAIDAGAMGFIPKTSTSSILVNALRLVLAKGIYLPPSAFLGSHAPTPPALPKAASPKAEFRPSDLGLTPRQADVLYQILQGKSVKLISRELGLATSTVKAHTTAVLRALNVTTRTQAIVAAGRLGLRFDEFEALAHA